MKEDRMELGEQFPFGNECKRNTGQATSTVLREGVTLR